MYILDGYCLDVDGEAITCHNTVNITHAAAHILLTQRVQNEPERAAFRMSPRGQHPGASDMSVPYRSVWTHFGQMKRLLSALETDTHSSASKYAVVHSFFFGPAQLISSGTFKKIQDWHTLSFHVLTAGHRIEPI